jgi:hypothetical protein
MLLFEASLLLAIVIDRREQRRSEPRLDRLDAHGP